MWKRTLSSYLLKFFNNIVFTLMSSFFFPLYAPCIPILTYKCRRRPSLTLALFSRMHVININTPHLTSRKNKNNLKKEAV
jgi:hypothetical protein